jgi:hypothetical protein
MKRLSYVLQFSGSCGHNESTALLVWGREVGVLEIWGAYFVVSEDVWMYVDLKQP